MQNIRGKSFESIFGHEDNRALKEHAVSSSQRSGHVTMGLLWLTMLSVYPAVLVGFDWYGKHFTFAQVLCSTSLSALILLTYSIPVCYIAAKTGLSFRHLCKRVFGEVGARSFSGLLFLLFLGWYAICSLLMADATTGVLNCKSYLPWLAIAFSYAMAFNNFFGFRGIANFARYFCGPILIAWILYTFAKVSPDVLPSLSNSSPTVPLPQCFCVVSQFIIGILIWGNEADYWRNAKPGFIGQGVSLSAGIIMGAIIFPATGWLIAHKSGISDSALCTAYMTNFSFAGIGAVALLVIGASYFAGNDSNVYALAHAAEAFTRLSHKTIVFVIATVGAVLSALLAVTGAISALSTMCSLSAVILPVASAIITAEWLIERKLGARICAIQSGTKIAALAFMFGVSAGLATSGILPYTEPLHVGIPPLQAWLIGLFSYIAMRLTSLQPKKLIAARRSILIAQRDSALVTELSEIAVLTDMS